jgi:kanamycin kinase/aminoglycoside 3'-phosphotransferase-3
MSRISGEMSCDDYYLEHSEILLKALADGLKMLWQVDVSGCPIVRDLDVVLQEARFQVKNNLVDLDNVEPDTFGENGFESPKHLLEWLENNRPLFEPVFSHGDYCLPNVFLENGQIKGFIDLGRAGIGDKWNDIALCYRSLKHNFEGVYGGKRYENFNPELLFEALGIEPNWEKIRYYLLLDELF